MEKNKLLIFLSGINEDYQSFNYANIEKRQKIEDFISILEDKFNVLGGIKYNLISQEDELLLRNFNYVYNGKFSKYSLYQKYFLNFDIYNNINPVLADQLKNKILEIKEYSLKNSKDINNIDELQGICSSLNKITFKFKLPSKNSNILSLIDDTYIFIFKSEEINSDVLKKVILNLKSILYLMEIELEVLLKEDNFLIKNIPSNIKNAYFSSNSILYDIIKENDFTQVLLSNFYKIYNEFIPEERLLYLKENSRYPIISPIESEVKEKSREEQGVFVKNRIIDFCFGVRMIYLKDYVFNTDKTSLEHYYILIISSFNRLKQVLVANSRL